MGYNVYHASIGDVVDVATQRMAADGSAIRMTVWRIEPPMTAGRRESDGPLVYVRCNPGGFGLCFDARHLADGTYIVTEVSE